MEINEKRVNQQIRNFERALDGYTYTEPLSRYLTRFFKENRQMGSSDRRMTSRFCYNYFRLGNSLKRYGVRERLIFAEYLCESESAVVSMLNKDLEESIEKDITEKVVVLKENYGFDVSEVFPFTALISDSIAVNEFLLSQFVQPDLFIRIKEGKSEYVQDVFSKNDIDFVVLSENTLALANGTRLQKVSHLEGIYEVQDLSSQKTIDFIRARANEKWWDTCAASGGKALMLLDKYPHVNLLVSDIRLSILRNLDERFERAGIQTPYRKKVLDLSKSVQSILGEEKFDGIILDAPCSGSGTWGRTPEMIQQFSADKLESFSTLQKDIASHVIPFMKKGGTLVYITCSIYRNENEEVVDYLLRNYNLELERMEVIEGYKSKADSMFAARFIMK